MRSRPGTDATDSEEVELTLLDEDERSRAALGAGDGYLGSAGEPKTKPMSMRDKRAMALLITLYLIQGVPLGLALGSVPFLLKDHLSYSELGVFSLSNYPYSLKLLWSPIVDSLYFTSIGRRKSWIIPMQLVVGSLMVYISFNVDRLIINPSENLYELTFVFTSLVLLSATQGSTILSGWALTLLSQDNLSYASTCQTIGLTTGYFASFTVFLALNSETFCDKWGIPQLTLSTYLKFCGLLCFAVTFWLIFFQKEGKESLDESEMTVSATYKTIWNICKLPHIRSLIVVHCLGKLAFQANESVTQLKMIEKGLGREDLAITVLIDFPFQIIGGWLAANWSRGDKPLRPWIIAFWPRLALALVSTLIVYYFPSPPISYGFFTFLVIQTVVQSFASNVQFVGISAFHTRISDPLIGGTYMTLLNTFSNFGGTWPKYFILKGVDLMSESVCQVKDADSDLLVKASECVSEHGKSLCADIGGECITEGDGYYWISAICMTFGVIFVVSYIIPTARRLQALPVHRWRISSE
ncbi:hypothetical protein CONPUDRAFT_45049 [Coniophora puteana RWD-64-598 SS2]|uniref:MFS general substrate transporter n=1 Tax=Coniophora puteana (strain RWD-64-598) TaxID=741705 RepID=A0A5M3N520_CONPW|nr:uncharacterized protein CONPUDRAFT_45049 [Coniophora puteana RWD-64-598 SS2]EIW86396.1 hypothetical protein CONPUDRAFT_45049 [Coniophora puteana RWD-64-598 SS2]